MRKERKTGEETEIGRKPRHRNREWKMGKKIRDSSRKNVKSGN